MKPEENRTKAGKKQTSEAIDLRVINSLGSES